MKKNIAIIVAGGTGTRMGASVKKQYLRLLDKEILAHTVEAFEKTPWIQEIIVVTGEEDIPKVKALLKEVYSYSKVSAIVKGGKERQNSVYNGLSHVPVDTDYVYIHDGARPFITQEVLERLKVTVEKEEACVVGVSTKDTIKRVDATGKVVETLRSEEHTSELQSHY